MKTDPVEIGGGGNGDVGAGARLVAASSQKVPDVAVAPVVATCGQVAQLPSGRGFCVLSPRGLAVVLSGISLVRAMPTVSSER